MSEVGDAIGTASTGALLGAALDGGGGAMQLGGKGHFHEHGCLNCGTALVGPHCHSCGQQAHLHRTMGAFFHDLLHGVLHFEGRTWRTLPLLAWRPGELTKRYIAGERRKFVSPMALFLFSVFLMFAVFSALGSTSGADLGEDGIFVNDVDAVRSKAVAERDAATAALAAPGLPAGQRAALEKRLASAEEDLAGIETVRGFRKGDIGVDDLNLTGIEAIDKGMIAKWRENPSLMFYKMQSNSYKYSWLLIPLSVPFLWLLFFWKRRYGGFDHAVFVTYSLSFMSLLFVVLSSAYLLGVPVGFIVIAALIVPPLHIYRQLRGAYDVGRLGALWRLAVLTVFITLILVLFVEALLLIGAF